MSNFIYHEPCPKCGSKNNLGVWADGHKWCFGCGYYVHSEVTSVKSAEHLLTSNAGYGEFSGIPDDFSYEIPKEALMWLKKYSLTNEEISENHIGWSRSSQMLVIPYFDNDNKCFLWQGRYFPSRVPKVYTSGQPERALLFQKGHSLNGRCVLVEDSISAIKVTRVVTSSPLLGAHLSIHKATLLSRYFNHLTLWLDYDKMSSMVKFCERYKYLFKTIDYVCTKKDPKDVPDEQIKELLNAKL